MRADLAQGTADHETGARSAAEAVQLAEQAGDATALVIARQSDALHYVVIDPDEALARLDHALELAGSLDDPRLERLLRASVSVTELSARRSDRGMEIAEEVGDEATGDGYDVFIANWAAWTGCLIRGDAERLRYWRERQRTFLSSIAIPERWMFLWSTALNHAMEGDDPIAGLRQARVRADSEGHDIAADVILALVVIELPAGRRTEAAELLGLAMRSRLNNLSHYVPARTLRARLRESPDHDTSTAAMRRGAQRDADEILDARGLSLDEPTAPA